MKRAKQTLTWLLIMTLILSSSMISAFATVDPNPSLTGLTGTKNGIDSGKFEWTFNSAGYSVDSVTALLNGNPQAIDLTSGLLELTGLESATKYELSIAVNLSKIVKQCFTIEKKKFTEDQVQTITEVVKVYGKRLEINQHEHGTATVYKYFLVKNKNTTAFDTLDSAIQSLHPGYSISYTPVDPDPDNSGWDIYDIGTVTFSKTVKVDVYKYGLLGSDVNNASLWYSTYEAARDAQLNGVTVYTEGDWTDHHKQRTVCYDMTVPFVIEAQKADFTTDTEYFTVTYDPDGGSFVTGQSVNTVAKHGSVTVPSVTKEGYIFKEWQYDVDGEFNLNDITFNINAIAIYELIITEEQPPEQPPQQTPEPQQPVVNYTLTVNVVNGTVPGFEGIHTFSAGTNVNLSALPESDLYEFVGWSGDLVSTDPNAVVVMTGDKVVTATFALIEEQIAQEAPVEPEIAEAVADEVPAQDLFLDEVTPQDAPVEMPNTSGIPAVAFSGLGSALLGLGTIIRRKLK